MKMRVHFLSLKLQMLGWRTKPVVDCSEGVRLCQSRALFKPVRSEICRTLSQINCRHGWHQSLEDPAPGCQKKCHTWPLRRTVSDYASAVLFCTDFWDRPMYFVRDLTDKVVNDTLRCWGWCQPPKSLCQLSFCLRRRGWQAATNGYYFRFWYWRRCLARSFLIT